MGSSNPGLASQPQPSSNIYQNRQQPAKATLTKPAKIHEVPNQTPEYQITTPTKPTPRHPRRRRNPTTTKPISSMPPSKHKAKYTLTKRDDSPSRPVGAINTSWSCMTMTPMPYSLNHSKIAQVAKSSEDTKHYTNIWYSEDLNHKSTGWTTRHPRHSRNTTKRTKSCTNSSHHTTIDAMRQNGLYEPGKIILQPDYAVQTTNFPSTSGADSSNKPASHSTCYDPPGAIPRSRHTPCWKATSTSTKLPWHHRAPKSSYMKNRTNDSHGILMEPKDGTLDQQLNTTDATECTPTKPRANAPSTRSNSSPNTPKYPINPQPTSQSRPQKTSSRSYKIPNRRHHLHM